MAAFDLMVIGTGSGLDVAAAAAERGLNVAIVEEGPFGGTCLNNGCIPSKMLIHCADVKETVERAHRFGIHAQVTTIDWPFIVRRASEEVDRDAAQIEAAMREEPNVTVIKGRARFVDAKAVAVGDERIRAETIVIAAGTRPMVPPIPGLAGVPYITSDEALRLPRQPERVIVLGGGFISAELAHFFGALGTDVTIVYRGPVLLRHEDEEVARRFTEVYQRRFEVILNGRVKRAHRDGDGVALDIAVGAQSRTITADTVLLATGRIPNTDRLDIGKTGVATDERGYVRVDPYLETNVPGIWALGDIVGRYLLKHSANLEAMHVAHNMLNSDSQLEIDYHAMPHAIFASPQVASVGLTEREAQEQGLPYTAATYAYRDTAYGSSIEDDDGFVKVLAHRESAEILGCHIIGTEASILIQEAVNAMRQRLPTRAIAGSIHIHPALPEVVQRAFASLPK